MKRITLAIVMCLFSLAAAGQSSPVAVIEEAAEELDQALSERREELAADEEALYGLVDEILLPRFDSRYAAQLVLARHWRSASDEQKERFVETFYTSMMEQYADAILEFDLDQLEILPYRGDPSDQRTMVRTTMQLDDGTTVPVDYVMIRRDSGWKIFDVRIEGISYVRRYRSDLDSEIRSTSLDDVIQRLEEDPEEIIGSDEE